MILRFLGQKSDPSLFLGPGMRLDIDLLHALRANMRINLRGAEAGMPQQRLHGSQIRAGV